MYYIAEKFHERKKCLLYLALSIFSPINVAQTKNIYPLKTLGCTNILSNSQKYSILDQRLCPVLIGAPIVGWLVVYLWALGGLSIHQ